MIPLSLALVIAAASPLSTASQIAPVSPLPRATSAPNHAYALIVANNTASDGALAGLRYADDDGARYYELLSLITEKAELLSVLDADTQRVFPEVAAIARAPSSSELERASTSLFEKIAADEKAGFRTTFYFVYVGHGSITESGEGAMHLSDRRFTRSDLFQHLISRSPARVNHVIIDACNAYLMVARRGADAGAEDRAIASFLSREDLTKYPSTGVLVSTSKAEDVHEWSRFEAGIFSHELRSALAGGADIDGDGVVTYAEVRAFLGAANGRVRDPKAKLDAFVRAPDLRVDEPLFDKKKARAPQVLLTPSLAGRRWLEDARGVRYADLNIATDGTVVLALVPSNAYFLRSETVEIRLPIETMASIDAGTLEREPRSIAERGSEVLAFQRELFAIPFGRAYFEGFRANAPIEDELRLRVLPNERGLPLNRLVSTGLAVGAVAAIATGIGFGIDAKNKAGDYRGALAPESELNRLHDASVRGARTANVLYAVGGGMIAGAVLTWWLFD